MPRFDKRGISNAIRCHAYGMSHAPVKDHTLLTVAECANALRVSPETIRRHFDDGTLAGVRLGSVRRVFASELERLATTTNGAT